MQLVGLILAAALMGFFTPLLCFAIVGPVTVRAWELDPEGNARFMARFLAAVYDTCMIYWCADLISAVAIGWISYFN